MTMDLNEANKILSDVKRLFEFGGRGGRGRDPFLMKAKRAGTDKNGREFKAGEEIMYYPNGKTILSGEAKDKAWREFEAAVADERMYNQ
jgi:antitoxin component YwqK of YwqJK toxin-antitoxin module